MNRWLIIAGSLIILISVVVIAAHIFGLIKNSRRDYPDDDADINYDDDDDYEDEYPDPFIPVTTVPVPDEYLQYVERMLARYQTHDAYLRATLPHLFDDDWGEYTELSIIEWANDVRRAYDLAD